MYALYLLLKIKSQISSLLTFLTSGLPSITEKAYMQLSEILFRLNFDLAFNVKRPKL